MPRPDQKATRAYARLFADPGAYDAWAVAWRRRLEEEPVSSARQRAAAMRMANPAFIPRNHLVEAALDAASGRQDFQPFEELLDVVSRPYEDRPGLERYATPPVPRNASSDFLRHLERRDRRLRLVADGEKRMPSVPRADLAIRQNAT